MSGKVAKKIRREAENETVGMAEKVTRRVYRQKKKAYKPS